MAILSQTIDRFESVSCLSVLGLHKNETDGKEQRARSYVNSDSDSDLLLSANQYGPFGRPGPSSSVCSVPKTASVRVMSICCF